MQHISLTQISLHGLPIRSFVIPKLRGYIGNRFREFDVLHNHQENDNLLRRYPSVQYKMIKGVPSIVGFREGAQVLQEMFLDLTSIQINQTVYPVDNIIQTMNSTLGKTDHFHTYRFVHPWMALNQKNHKLYKSTAKPMRNAFLAKILRGNLMSLSNGFDYRIPNMDTLEVYVDAKETHRSFKGVKMLCFTGSFSTNFRIPNHLGLGKQAARGFGTVEEV